MSGSSYQNRGYSGGGSSSGGGGYGSSNWGRPTSSSYYQSNFLRDEPYRSSITSSPYDSRLRSDGYMGNESNWNTSSNMGRYPSSSQNVSFKIL